MKKHDAEFKAKIVALTLAAQAAGTPSVASIAKEHGLASSQPYEWLKQADKGALKQTTTKYDPEFKARLVARFRAAKAAGVPIADIVREEKLKNDTLIYQWVKQADAAEGGKGKKPTKASQTREQYSREFKEKAVALVASGLSYADAGRRMNVHQSSVKYWHKIGIKKGARETSERTDLIPVDAQLPITQVRAVNGHVKDALLYLRHAERDILDLIRDGKLARPDSAHLLTLLALQELSKAINS